MSNIKICSKCGRIGLDQYDYYIAWNNHRDTYRYRSECNICSSKQSKSWIENNLERWKVYKKQYYQDNIEYIKEYEKQFYVENKKHYKEQKKQYYQDNKEYRKEYSREWRQDNPEYNKQWQQDNPDKINVNCSKYRASKLNQTPELTENEKAKVELYYRVSQQLGSGWEVDHIIPISKGGLHHPDNLQVTTKEYNMTKHNNENYRKPNTLEHWKI